MRRILVVVWNLYNRALDSRPLLTQAATTGRDHGLFPHSLACHALCAGFVCGRGDVIAQGLIEGKRLKQYDLPRTVRMTAIGFFFTVSELITMALFMRASE